MSPRRVADAALLAAVDLYAFLAHPVTLKFLLRNSGGRFPRIAVPRSVNEKFAWRKVFDRDPLWTTLSDKIEAKAWARSVVPELRTARLLWVGTDPDAIPDAVFARDVVFKANHASGTNLVVRRGALDRARLRACGQEWLAWDFGARCGEWGYKHVRRRLLVEELVGRRDAPLQELKFYTFGTRIERLIQIVDRFGSTAGRRYDRGADGALVDSGEKAEVGERLWEGGLPPSLPEALRLARRLGAPFDHVRVDLFTDGESVWFNKMTLYNMGGCMSRIGADPWSEAAQAWDLRRSAFLRRPPSSGWRARYAVALARGLSRRADGSGGALLHRGSASR